MWMESNFWHHSGSWGTWVKLTHKTPHLQTLGPKTQNTGWQESLPHTPARGQGESSRGLDQIIYCSRGKSEKTGFNRCSGSSGRIQPQGSFLPHPHPQKKVIKLVWQPKPNFRIFQGRFYCKAMAALSWISSICSQALWQTHILFKCLSFYPLFPIKGKSVPK